MDIFRYVRKGLLFVWMISSGLLLAGGVLIFCRQPARAARAVKLEHPADAPEVVFVSPASNTHTVAAGAPVLVGYDQPLSPTTVVTQALAVHGMQTGQVTRTLSISGSEIRLTPDQPFHPGELVQATATTRTLALGGEQPLTSTVWQFWTAVAPSTGVFTDSGQNLGNESTYAVDLGDLDGDGDLDAFSAHWGQPDKVWLNMGGAQGGPPGVFADSGQSLTMNSIDGVLGDLDNDGDLDIFVSTQFDAGNWVWLNDGQGVFTASGQLLPCPQGCHLADLGDLDGDGDLDIVVSGSPGSKVWLNDGTGHFGPSEQDWFGSASSAVALGDLDLDGDLDAFNYSFSIGNMIFLNDGSGNFTDTGQSLGVSQTADISLGDVDLDGDLDAFLAIWGNPSAGANQVWLNDGAGFFLDSGQRLGNTYSASARLGDLDGDGDLDAFSATAGGSTYPNEIWLNDGTGVFFDSGQRLGNMESWDVGLGDLDGDGDLDAFVGNYLYPNKVWLNGSALPPPALIGSLPPANTHTAPLTTAVTAVYNQPLSSTTASTRTLAVHAMQSGLLTRTITVQGNALRLSPARPFFPGEWVQATATTATLSAFGGHPLTPTVWIFRTIAHGGSGSFVDTGQQLATWYAWDVSLGDVDLDGDLDALVGNEAGSNQLWLNDGTGFFTASGQIPASLYTQAVALGDLDGDGDLDAFIGNIEYSPNQVWLNQGGRQEGEPGVFVDSGQALGAADTIGLVLGDFDGDGDLDAYVINWDNGDSQIWLNDGAGGFTLSPASLPPGIGHSGAVGDLDGDGDLDLLSGDFGTVRAWSNDGQGIFSQTDVLTGFWEVAALELGDVDGDGDLDALAAEYYSNDWTHVLLNDGAGTFTDSGQVLGGGSRAALLGDLDGDGDLDAVVGNAENREVWLNDGSGLFTFLNQYSGSAWFRAGELGDLDGDGDLDLFHGNSSYNYIWINANSADLVIRKTSSPAEAVVNGGPITFTLAYTNTGPQTANRPVIADLLSPSLTDVAFSFSGAPITATAGLTYAWQVADLPPGAGGRITVTAVVSAPVGANLLTNTVSITSFALDANLANNLDAVTVTLINPGVSLSPGRGVAADPGARVLFTHTLTNTGNSLDTFLFSCESLSGWAVACAPPAALAAGQSLSFTIAVSVPGEALYNELDHLRLTAASQADPAVRAVVTDTATVNQVAAVALSPGQAWSAWPGSVVQYTHTLTNTGNGPDEFTISCHSDLDWAVVCSGPLSLGPNQTSEVFITVTVPTQALPGVLDTITLTATSQVAVQVVASASDTVQIPAGLSHAFIPLVRRSDQLDLPRIQPDSTKFIMKDLGRSFWPNE